MKKTFALAAAAAGTALTLAAGAAHADRGGVSWSVGVSLPGVTTVVGTAPPAAYYAPPAAYYPPPRAYYGPPAPVYAPRAGYYAPPPVAYVPRVADYAPPLVVPAVPRVWVPHRHHGWGQGWGPGPVAYAPPAVYGPPAVMSPRPYDGRWR